MGLFSNRAPTAKFNAIGDSCTGVIVDIGQEHRTEFTRDGSIGAPMYWYDRKPTPGVAVDPKTGQENQPVMDPVITVDTDQPDDYGNTERRIFVKGRAELASIKEACKAAGVRDIEAGGRLTKTWASGAGGTQDPRVYVYRYAPPSADPAPAEEPPASPAAKRNGWTTEKHKADMTLLKDAQSAARRAADNDEPPF